MLFKWSIVSFFSATLVELTNGEPISCHRGEYLDQDQQRCLSCPEGTFISHDNHQFVDCQRCSEPDAYQHETAAKPCTAVSNTIIGCSPGYFRENRDHYAMVAIGECEKCSVCEYKNLYEVQPCTPFSDTVCCPQPDMLATRVPNKHGKCSWECQIYP